MKEYQNNHFYGDIHKQEQIIKNMSKLKYNNKFIFCYSKKSLDIWQRWWNCKKKKKKYLVVYLALEKKY